LERGAEECARWKKFQTNKRGLNGAIAWDSFGTIICTTKRKQHTAQRKSEENIVTGKK